MQIIKDNVTILPETGCWVWNKSVSSAGYGQFTKNGKYWATHRYVFTTLKGEIPEGMVIRHSCHNKRCCNPDHLSLGTHKDNWKDSEEIHRSASSKRAKSYIIKGVCYRTVREAKDKTGINMDTLIKYTDKDTRVFDIKAYYKGCEISKRWSPKV